MHKSISITIVSCFLFVNFLCANSDKIVDSAWQHIAQNNFGEAKTLLKEAIDNDSNPRAYIALSYIQQLLGHEKESWSNYEKALKKLSNPYPYIFASVLTARSMASPYPVKDVGIMRIYPELIENPADKDGLLHAGTYEKLGRYHLASGDMDDAMELFDKMGAVDQWTLIGPFENISASGFEKVFEPELAYDAKKEYLAKNGILAKWFKIEKIRHDMWIDFTRYFAHGESIFYGNTFVFSETEKKVHVRIGTSGSLKLFLNDQELYANEEENNNDLDTYIVETTLQKGWNRVLIKCGYSEISQCNFLVRITTEDGKYLSDLKYDTNLQDYPKGRQVEAKLIPNFAELYFQNAIKENPQYIENYLLLAESYLRNDKAIDAEKVLNAAAEIMPQSVLIKSHLLEAYIRGEKFDEISTTQSEITSLFPDVPFVIEYRFGEESRNGNIEKLEIESNNYSRVLPQSAKAMIMEIGVLFQKGQFEPGIQLLKKAFDLYPDSWDVVYLSALISTRTTQSYDGAIEIYNNYLKKFRVDNAYLQLAQMYLNASNVDKYEETYKALLKTDPAATGIYFNMAQIFLQVQQYSKAKEYIKETLGLCPINSTYWALYGDIYQGDSNTEEAVRGYQLALKYDAKNYEARRRLRGLQGKPDVFSYFEKNNIDSLIANSPNKDNYEEDDSVILVDDTKMVVYHNGASEKKMEMLVKIFNADGIESYKEYWLSTVQSSENLIVEKAVTIKQDGSEIKADVSGSHLVFKSLEPNDHIYFSWKVETRNRGRLSSHFWDEAYFNYFHPAENVNYALIVPEDIQFSYKTQFMPETPITKNTDLGILYKWKSRNQPSIKSEYNMPDFDDIAKMLFISSIPDWEYLVDWYLDLAKTKYKGTYEVKDIVQEMFKDFPEATEMEKLQRIYEYITENVAYSSVSFRQSGLIPQQARKVLVQRIGDCKDVATLCIAMLQEVGINAHYVLVNTYDEGQNKNILPSIDFNHAIVGAQTSSGTIYMDLTAKNYPMSTVPMADVEAFALEIKEGVKEPFYLKDKYFSSGKMIRNTTVKLLEDNSADILIESIREGANVAGFRETYRYKGKKDRITDLTETLADNYANVKIEHLNIDDLETTSEKINYDYRFTVPYYLEDAGRMKLLKLPWSNPLEPKSSVSYEERTYDLVYRIETDTTLSEMTIHLPEGYSPIEVPEDINYSCDFAEYSLSMKYEKGTIRAYRRYIIKQGVIPAAHYKDYKDFYNKSVRADATQLILKNDR